MLPPEVLQAYGIPPPLDPSLAGGPQFDPGTGIEGLHPLVAQAYGLAPPPALPSPPQPEPQPDAIALPPPIPDALPSMAPIAAPGASTPIAAPGVARGDYPVPASAFGPQATPAPAKPAAPGAAARQPTPQQLEAEARAKQGAADQQSAASIGAQQQVATDAAQQNLATYQQYAAIAKDNEEQRKALQDDITKTRAEKQAYVEGTQRDVDNYKIDQNKFVNEQGLGDRFGWAIAAALGAVGQALQRGTGPNPVIEMMQKRMHDSVVAQMDERDQLKEKNARAEHALDKFDAFSKDRLAQTEMLDARNDRWLAQQVALTGAKMADPQARATAQQQYAALMQSSAEKFQKAADTAVTHDVQQRQLGIEAGKLAEEKRKNLVQEGWQQTKFNEEQQMKAAALMAKQQGKLTDEESKRAVYGVGADGRREPLRNKDGSVVIEGNPELADKKNRMIAAATAYNRLTNQMRRAIADHGGESTWVKGGDWQRMISDLQSATAELHDAYGITAFREPTVQFFEKMASAGVDPTSFVRDASAALEHSNQNLQSKVNEMITGYDGPPIKWTDTSKPAPPGETPNDVAVKALEKTSGEDIPSIFNAESGKWLPKLPGSVTPIDPDASGAIPPAAVQDAQRFSKQHPGVGMGERSLLEGFGVQLRSTDPSIRDNAARVLGTLANDARSDGVREYAQQLLLNNIAPNEGGSTATVETTPASANTTTTAQNIGPLHPDVARAFGIR